MKSSRPWLYRRASSPIVARSSTAIQRQLFMLPPLGAWNAIARHSSISARGTGFARSSKTFSSAARIVRDRREEAGDRLRVAARDAGHAREHLDRRLAHGAQRA